MRSPLVTECGSQQGYRMLGCGASENINVTRGVFIDIVDAIR